MAEKAKNTSKKKKKPFEPMEIAKVPLNQEQAVLSCCEQPERGFVDLGNPPGYEQCISGCGFPSASVSS